MNSYNFGQQNNTRQTNKDVYEPVWADNFFNEQEINELIAIGEKESLQPAQIGGNDERGFDSSQRRTLVSWINTDVAPTWFAGKIENLFQQINKDHFKFEITGAEPAQYTKYDAEFLGEYKWHADITMFHEHMRKLSCSILLSDPTEYEGGNLILSPHGNPITVGDKKCRAIFFPSWVPHCVTPVTKGIRRSLVLWAHGPAFK
jgi:PKHD-type hydroxylase